MSKMPFTALNVGATYDTGDDPVSGRVQSAVGPEIFSWIGYGFISQFSSNNPGATWEWHLS